MPDVSYRTGYGDGTYGTNAFGVDGTTFEGASIIVTVSTTASAAVKVISGHQLLSHHQVRFQIVFVFVKAALCLALLRQLLHLAWLLRLELLLLVVLHLAQLLLKRYI